MKDEPEKTILQRLMAGDERAFEQMYALCSQKVRLMAWRLVRRADGVDDLFNETWCRAFAQRSKYDSKWPFLVWMAGILKNVHRESFRQKGGRDLENDPRLDGVSPEQIASEAEALVGLQSCVENLSPQDAQIVRLRFFENRTLRSVSQALSIPESTLRDTRLPVIMDSLRACLEKKGIDFSVFSAQGPLRLQYRDEE